MTFVRASLVALALLLTLAALAQSPSIGVVTARGPFRLDNSEIYSNSTLFDGAALEAQAVPLRLLLNGGSQLDLAPGAAGKAYQDRLWVVALTGPAPAKPPMSP
jgi:hypothetical protein